MTHAHDPNFKQVSKSDPPVRGLNNLWILTKIIFSINFFQLQISTGWQMLDGTRNPDVDGEPLKNAFANVLGAAAVAAGPSR